MKILILLLMLINSINANEVETKKVKKVTKIERAVVSEYSKKNSRFSLGVGGSVGKQSIGIEKGRDFFEDVWSSHGAAIGDQHTFDSINPSLRSRVDDEFSTTITRGSLSLFAHLKLINSDKIKLGFLGFVGPNFAEAVTFEQKVKVNDEEKKTLFTHKLNTASINAAGAITLSLVVNEKLDFGGFVGVKRTSYTSNTSGNIDNLETLPSRNTKEHHEKFLDKLKSHANTEQVESVCQLMFGPIINYCLNDNLTVTALVKIFPSNLTDLKSNLHKNTEALQEKGVLKAKTNLSAELGFFISYNF